MPEAISGLRYGRIIYAWISDRNGFSKLRPALVLTSTREITTAQPIVVAAITTTFADPPGPFCAELPWDPSGRAGTKLRKRSAAVVNWLASISTSDIIGYGGDVPTRIMNRIEQLLDDLPVD